MSHQHLSHRRRAYGRRQHELHERAASMRERLDRREDFDLSDDEPQRPLETEASEKAPMTRALRFGLALD